MLLSPSPRRRRSLRPLTLETLEPRTVLSTITVMSLADSGTGSLREAITQANSNSDFDTIQFAPSVTGQILLQSVLPDLASNMIITGPGASVLEVTRNDPTHTSGFRILHVTAGSTVAISGLTLSHGGNITGGGIYNEGILTVASSVIRDNQGEGGGIYNSGALTVAYSTIQDNSSPLEGGGIRNFAGTLTVTHCTFSGNDAYGAGGAITNAGGITSYSSPPTPGIATITDSVFRNNSANIGGAIENLAGTVLNLVNATISGNLARGSGGGITNFGVASITGTTISGNQAPNGNGGGIDNVYDGALTIVDSTINDNLAPYGGGIYLLDGTLTLTNSTVSGNASIGNGGGLLIEPPATATVVDSTIAGNSANVHGSGIVVNGSLRLQTTILDNSGMVENLYLEGGTVTSLGHNLFSDTPSITLDPTDLVNTNPLLGPLADNGGPTQTMALLPGSPAIDAGVMVAGVTTDQRGITRPQGSAPDIGAYESRGFSINISAGNGQNALIGTAFAAPLTVNVASPYGEPVAGGVVAFDAPTNGASAVLSSGSAPIDANGQASVNATANGQIGSYNVTTQSSGATGPAFTLTNLPVPIPPLPPTPTVVSLERFGIHLQPTSIVVRFSQAMDAGRADNLANYRLVTAGRDGKFGTRDDRVIRLRSAQYDPPTQSVRLATKVRLPLAGTYQLTITGTPPEGLTGTDGVGLGGAGSDQPGSNYVATINRSSLVLPVPAPLVHHPKMRRVHHKQ